MIAYELHVTIEPSKTTAETLRKFCRQSGYKFLDLQLATGSFSRQIMMAINFDSEDNKTAKLIALEHTFQMYHETSLPPIRIKLESRRLEDPGSKYYFEAHWKFLQLPTNEQKQQFPKNLLISYSNDLPNICYATVRYPTDTDVKLIEADVEKMTLVFKNMGIAFKHPHIENVIFDTNLSIDNGWTEGIF